MSELNFRNGRRVFSKTLGDFYYDNGRKAFNKNSGDILYRNGRKAYSGTMDKAFYENGQSMGSADGVGYSAEGVYMNLGPNVDSFEVNLGEGLLVRIQVGHSPNFKNAQLYGVNGQVIFEV